MEKSVSPLAKDLHQRRLAEFNEVLSDHLSMLQESVLSHFKIALSEPANDVQFQVIGKPGIDTSDYVEMENCGFDSIMDGSSLPRGAKHEAW